MNSGNGTTPQEHPAFVCRREGHVPALELRPNVFVEAFVCRCERCGRYATFESRKPIRVQ